MLTTVESIRKMYPKTRANAAASGYIPIAVFDAVEADLRKDMRAKGLRAVFRGPRPHYGNGRIQSRTWRRDATHVVLYYC